MLAEKCASAMSKGNKGVLFFPSLVAVLKRVFDRLHGDTALWGVSFWCQLALRACFLIAIGEVFLLENGCNTGSHFPRVDAKKHPVNAPNGFFGDRVDLVGQPGSDGHLAGPRAFTDPLQADGVLAGIATAYHTEIEVGDAIVLLIETSKETVCVMHETMPLGPIRTRSSILPTPYVSLGASTPDAGPLPEVPREVVFTSSHPWALPASTGPWQASNSIGWQMPCQAIGRNPQ